MFYANGMKVEDIRLKNVSWLIDKFCDGKKNRFAEFIDKQPSYVSRWYTDKEENKRNISGDSARLIEEAFGKEEGWLDKDHTPSLKVGDFKGITLASSKSGASERQGFDQNLRSVPVFSNKEIISGEKEDQERCFIQTDISVSDKAFAWSVKSSDLGSLGLPFPIPVIASVIVEPDLEPSSNDIIIVVAPGENVQLKRIDIDGPNRYLHSLNAQHLPIMMTDDYEFKGTVVSINLKTK